MPTVTHSTSAVDEARDLAERWDTARARLCAAWDALQEAVEAANQALTDLSALQQEAREAILDALLPGVVSSVVAPAEFDVGALYDAIGEAIDGIDFAGFEDPDDEVIASGRIPMEDQP